MDARRGPFDEFAIAAGVLTRFPIAADAAEPGAIAASGWAFPLVGGGIGALCAVAFFAAALLGLPVGPAALLAVAAGIAATGALHEDGLADTADGFGGGRDRDRKLAIMRDSAHGTYGVVALVLSIGLRATAIAAIRDPVFVGLALIAAHAASRAALPPAMLLLRPARADGLGAAAGRPSRAVALAAALIGAAIALATLGPLTGAVALAAGRRRGRARRDACAAANRRLHRRRSRLFSADRRDRDAARGGGQMSERLFRILRRTSAGKVSPFGPGAIGAGSAGQDATTTRFWWVRHAPVEHGGRIYGQTDMPCDCTDAAVFAGLARQLPRDAVVGHEPSAPHARNGAGDRARRPARTGRDTRPRRAVAARSRRAEFRRLAGPDL